MIRNEFLNSIFENSNYLAHIPDEKNNSDKKVETLKEHSKLCITYFDKIDKNKKVKEVVYRIICECGCEKNEFDYIWNMFRNAVLMHDIGKINPTYQYKKLKNKLFKEESERADREGDHSLLSSYIYLNEYMKELSDENSLKRAPYLISFAYCISRHHCHLDHTDDFANKLSAWLENSPYKEKLNLKKPIFISTKKLLIREIKNEAAYFVLARLLFSLITACDFYATSEYKSGKSVEVSCTMPFDEIYKNYTSSDLYQNIDNYRKKDKPQQLNDINQLRSELFLEAEQTLMDNMDKNIFYLEAPTGSGKTNTSINLFLKLLNSSLNLNNVFYIFPFNTLVEQTRETLEEYIKPTYMSVINSLTPIKKNATEEYEDAFMNRIAMNYPIVVTSHVNLFNTLFGTTREQVFSLFQFCNSVIIMDEIQSYRIGIWSELIILLRNYAKLLNIKVIIMSATLPKLNMLIDKNNQLDVVNLIKNTDYYFKNYFFKNRVEVDFSLMDRKYSLEEIAEKVLLFRGSKVLIEFIKKSTARKFYNYIITLDCGEAKVIELTGDDNIDTREKVLLEIKTATNIILIATQVIEAGVDIDMDIGFKDTSIPDSEEQFVGRINRSCRKSGSKIFFFHHDDAKEVYQKNGTLDVRLKYSIDKKEYADLFVNKEFRKLYELVIEDIRLFRSQKNGQNIETVYNNCRNLNFREIENTMSLMEPNYQLYLGYKLHRNNGEIIDGNSLWLEYKELCSNNVLGYAEKRIRLSELYSKMTFFTYNLRYADSAKFCGEEFGGYIYIQNGDEFMDNGKFDRQKLIDFSKRLIL
ncbi:MAG: CRISPR-associated helicase Cas3/CRISPR-associated endonuclease Cas3-HD [Clostridiales bacterium]|jgi:CRISPR-associated endonuclease/helicase Cas3|nr:CRISPR-associated helicase Cas3/CRISPR-associated endonuclease Cas3-HD [Clostridiales bacterium]